MNNHVIGIIGGMGPEATAELFNKIIRNTKAQKDQDHFHVIIDSNAKIPDRTTAILYGGESPVPYIVASAQRLEQLGAQRGCIPCMTSHYFIEEIQSQVALPLINIFEEIKVYVDDNHNDCTKIGVLATTGTVSMGLFDRYLEGYEVIYPSKHTQENYVMEAIYGEKGIKAGHITGEPIELLVTAVHQLMEAGAEVIIMGCTEIGLVLKQEVVKGTLIDPLAIAAYALIKE